MKRIYGTLLTVLVVVAFQAAPALAGEQHRANQTYNTSSTHRSSTAWETPTAPFGFSPAPPSTRHGEKIGTRPATTAKADISSSGPAAEGYVTARKEEVSAPRGFSPAPTRWQERITLSARNAESPSSLSAMENGRYTSVGISAASGSAPLGFFPVRGKECAYRAC
jgi:hypothetical protein